MKKYLLFFIIIFLKNSTVVYSTKIDMQYNDLIYISEGSYVPLFKENNNKNIDVFVNRFFIDIYSITNIEYRKFIKNNINWHKNKFKLIFSDVNYLSHWNFKKFKFIQNSPVVNVSWYSCNAYCKMYNKRLPIIDEWEYIMYKFFSKKNNYIQEILNWYVKPVTSNFFSRESIKNNDGIYGINGIIWEWVDDFNSIVIIGSDSEGGDVEQLLFCGTASVNSVNPSDYVSFMRFAFRSSLEAKYNISSLGFRCVKDI